jgi:hypothetical protein
MCRRRVPGPTGCKQTSVSNGDFNSTYPSNASVRSPNASKWLKQKAKLELAAGLPEPTVPVPIEN